MKKILFTLIMLSLLVSVTHAGLAPSILPSSTHYQGQHDRSFNFPSGDTLDVHLEFAVYTENQFDDIGYTGDSDYVYAYQVFSGQSSTVALTYFALTGVNPSTIADVQNDIDELGSLKEGTIQSGGEMPISSGFNLSVTEAVWEFDDGDGAIVQGEQSWFLFLYSDYDWGVGDIEVVQQELPDIPDIPDDIPIPGDDGNGSNSIPEPATLILLGLGTFTLFKTRKN